MAISKILVVPGVMTVAVVAGLSGGSFLNSTPTSADTSMAGSATTQSSTASADISDSHPVQRDQSQGGHIGKNGTKEVLLTGDTATKAKAAAEAAVSGGTVLRVENDAEGATYEAHVTKSDGSQVTVKMDATFKVTSIENGPA